jgi:heat-inducible transcriptional repressor
MSQQPPKLPPGLAGASLAGLDSRSASILRELVEVYVQTGEPVGSRTLSRRLPLGLSPASIRNVMADLEEAGFLYAPHTSAGRLPTDRGLRMFVDGLLEFGDLGEEERDAIAARCAASGRSMQDTLAEAGQMLSGLASNSSASAPAGRWWCW